MLNHINMVIKRKFHCYIFYYNSEKEKKNRKENCTMKKQVANLTITTIL